MAVTDSDLELLEGYLDDALEMGEAKALRARLDRDDEFAQALEQIRGERAIRRAFFTSLEPDQAAVAQLTTRVRSGVQAGRASGLASRGILWRPIGFLSAAAACVAIGFLARGWFEPKHPGDGGDISMVGQSRGLKVEKIETYQVTLRDEAGNVVGVQKFDSLEKAQEFAADLARWQSRSERLASGQFVLHKDRF